MLYDVLEDKKLVQKKSAWQIYSAQYKHVYSIVFPPIPLKRNLNGIMKKKGYNHSVPLVSASRECNPHCHIEAEVILSSVQKEQKAKCLAIP